MATSSQLLKGLMDGVILKIIDKEETYGYEIYEKLQNLNFDDFYEGSLYPILLRQAEISQPLLTSLYPLLLRLEKKKLIKGTKRPSEYGPDRKYYSLTEEGINEMNSFKDTWDKINMSVNKLWNN